MKSFISRLIGFLKKDNSLRQKAMRGSLWVGGAIMVDRVLRLVRNIVLARILLPEAFGVMAIVLAVNQAFESFTDLGITKVIIQNPKGDTRDYLNTAWWLSFWRTAALYLVIFLMAPVIAGFYKTPELASLIRLVFAGAVFKGCWSPEAYSATKHLKFGRFVIMTQGSGLMGIVLAIILAFYLKNVWALALALLFENVLACILSFIVFPFQPKLKFKKEVMAEFSHFSRGYAGLPILTFVFMKADVFFLGKMHSQEGLGIYTMAATLAIVPFEALTSIFNKIGFSLFSKKQNDNEWICKSILFFSAVIVMLGLPLLSGVFGCGKEILSVVYGEKYSQCAVAFILLFASNLLKTIGLPIIQVYLSKGMPSLHRKFTTMRALLLLVLLYPAISLWGLTGAALAGLTAISLSFLVQLTTIHNLTGLKYESYGLLFLKGMLYASPTLVVSFVLKRFDLQNQWFLIGGIGFGVMVSLAVSAFSLYRMYKFHFSRQQHLNNTRNE